MQQEKAYLVTGASSGIGYETALALALEEQNKVIAVSRNAGKLQQLREASGNKIETHLFDLDGGNFNELYTRLEQSGLKHLHGLVHNAGFLVNRSYADITREELEQCYRVNVFAPFLLSQCLLPLLKAAGSAHIVHISSIGGVQGSVKFPGLSAYSSSKGALAVLSECLATELAPEKIKVNCLALGAVQTEMLSMAFPGYEAPLQAHDMGTFVSWFVVNGHRFFNGKILPVALSTP
ncbi:MAG: SDR family oxidoreductase [Bacteroidia bacterium]|nr:SDR family oxidoreductase [Bacteroidia bacterium]